jgi:sulfur-oxidizing protein SoxB
LLNAHDIKLLAITPVHSGRGWRVKIKNDACPPEEKTMNSLRALFERLSSCVGRKKIVLSAALLLSSVIGGTVLLTACDVGDPLQILWTNDTHGFFLPVYHAEYSEIDSYAQTAATEGKVGGYAQIAGLVKKLKEGIWEHNTLFVDAGDTFDGSPVAQMTRGQAVIPVLNAMGYDAWTPGNRDFAWPKADFLAVTSQLNFPMVCANLQDATTGEFVFPRYIVKQVGGLKIAIIGLTSLAGGGQGFQLLGGNTPGTVLEDSISTLAADIRAQENPDLIVALSHMGFYQDQKIASRTTGIDVIVGAHTHHNVYAAPVIANADGSRNVIVVQAGSHGKFLGKLNLWVKDQKVVNFNNELIRVSTKNLEKLHVTPDPKVQALAEQAYAPFKAMLDQVVGYTTTVLERRGDTQSTMTNFLNDALAERYGVDGARFPGIRYGSSVIPGPITVGDVWNIVSPNFGNNMVYTFTQTGTQILATLNGGLNTEYGPDPYNWNGGDVFRFNGRVKYTYNVNAPNNQHLVDVSVTKTDGTTVTLMTGGVTVPANLATVFTFATTMGGGAPVPNVTAVDEIVAYIQSKPNHTISAPIDDRTVQLDNGPSNIADVN